MVTSVRREYSKALLKQSALTILELSMQYHTHAEIPRPPISKSSWLYGTCFSENSGPDDAWQAFLDFMEHYGLPISAFQFSVAISGILIRYFKDLRPLDSIPLAALLCFNATTFLLTPPKSNPRWDRNLRTSFIDVLRMSRRQQATEPKDKVYALYGLLQQLEIPLLAEPDYSPDHSLEEAYRNFAVSIINWHHSLDLLLEASGPWGTNAPSWVPQWNRPYRRVRVPGSDTENPTADAADPFSFSTDLRRLRVSGRYFGKVLSCAERLECAEDGSTSPSHTQMNATILGIWIREVLETYYLSLQEAAHRFSSVFGDSSSYAPVDFEEWLQFILEAGPGASSGIRRSPHLSTATSAYQLTLPNISPDTTNQHLHNRICSTLVPDLTVFATGSGDGIASVEGLGIGPAHMRPDDVVVRFTTPAVPMIIRALNTDENEYDVVGASRVSWMRGPTEDTRERAGEGLWEMFRLV